MWPACRPAFPAIGFIAPCLPTNAPAFITTKDPGGTVEIRIIIGALVAVATFGALAYKASDLQAAFEEKQRSLHEYWRSSASPPDDKSGH
jgi:hypothetical protein